MALRPANTGLKLSIGLVALLATLTGSLARVMTGAGPDPGAPPPAAATDIQSLRRPMVEVLRAHYYRDIDEAALLAAPVEQWPALLDDTYTHVIQPATLAALERADSGRYAGIGIHAHADADRIVIDTVFDGSPAAAAGLRSGDELVEADGEPLAGLDLDAALTHIRGPEGEAVTVTVRRDGTALSATVVRRNVAARLVWSQLRTVGARRIGVVTIVEFGQGAGPATRSAVADLRAQGAEAIVLDLRHNPGGLVAEAVAVASAFLPAGAPVLIERGRHIATTVVRTRTGPVAPGLPLAAVVLDGQSASSSEVVAGALRDGLAVPLVGQRSFGKGVIQDLYPLPGGAALKATFAEYLTPAGTAINRTGLQPDVVLPGPAGAPSATGADSGLDRALQALDGQPGA